MCAACHCALLQRFSKSFLGSRGSLSLFIVLPHLEETEPKQPQAGTKAQRWTGLVTGDFGQNGPPCGGGLTFRRIGRLRKYTALTAKSSHRENDRATQRLAQSVWFSCKVRADGTTFRGRKMLEDCGIWCHCLHSLITVAAFPCMSFPEHKLAL